MNARVSDMTQASLQRRPRITVVRSLSMERATRDHRRFLALQQEFARRGFTLHELSGSTVLVQRWGLTRVLADLGEAERFIRQVGGQA